jgi:hypothetical protein
VPPSLQSTGEVHLAEGKFLLELQTLNVKGLWHVEKDFEGHQFPKEYDRI